VPLNPIVNRRGADSPFVRRTVLASSGALDRVSGIAATLSVSQASIIDAALRHVGTLDQCDIIDLLRHHGHLTDEEYAVVVTRAAAVNQIPRRS
jgi:hypothetical protein